MALPASDNFNRPDENPLGGNWTAPDGVDFSKFLLSSHFLVGQGGSTFQLMYWNADSFGSDHKSQATLNGTGLTTAYGGVAVRIQASGQACYVFGDHAGTYKISRMDAGALTNLSTVTGTPTVGDVLRLEVSGADLTAFVNGSTPSGGTANDATYTGGAAGLWGYSGLTAFELDDWSADNVSGGSPPPSSVGRLGLLFVG
jgi:hypothetical protein